MAYFRFPHRFCVLFTVLEVPPKKLRKEGGQMSWLKTTKISLMLTAVVTTVLFVAFPLSEKNAIWFALYFFLVLLPLLVALFVQLFVVWEKAENFREALRDWQRALLKKAKKLRLAKIRTDAFHPFAEWKSEGINPNRAGPLAI